MKKESKSQLREWTEALVFAVIIAFALIRPFIIQAFKIPTGSMRPTLIEGDIILVNKFIYGAKVPFTKLNLPKLTDPKRGDIIVFIYPENPKKDFIKRLIAFEGETVEIKDGTIYIDGKPLLDKLFTRNIDGTIRYYYNRGDFEEDGFKIIVPEGSYFVLGDNSAASLDSRFWGFVPRSNLLGKAMLIYWPFNRTRMLK